MIEKSLVSNGVASLVREPTQRLMMAKAICEQLQIQADERGGQEAAGHAAVLGTAKRTVAVFFDVRPADVPGADDEVQAQAIRIEANAKLARLKYHELKKEDSSSTPQYGTTPNNDPLCYSSHADAACPGLSEATMDRRLPVGTILRSVAKALVGPDAVGFTIVQVLPTELCDALRTPAAATETRRLFKEALGTSNPTHVQLIWCKVKVKVYQSQKQRSRTEMLGCVPCCCVSPGRPRPRAPGKTMVVAW
jgi:hypothetical protein